MQTKQITKQVFSNEKQNYVSTDVRPGGNFLPALTRFLTGSAFFILMIPASVFYSIIVVSQSFHPHICGQH